MMLIMMSNIVLLRVGNLDQWWFLISDKHHDKKKISDIYNSPTPSAQMMIVIIMTASVITLAMISIRSFHPQ